MVHDLNDQVAPGPPETSRVPAGMPTSGNRDLYHHVLASGPRPHNWPCLAPKTLRPPLLILPPEIITSGDGEASPCPGYSTWIHLGREVGGWFEPCILTTPHRFFFDLRAVSL